MVNPRSAKSIILKCGGLALLVAINIFGIAVLIRGDGRAGSASATETRADHDRAIEDVMRLRAIRARESTYVATHVVLEEDGPWGGDTFIRRGPVLILGREGSHLLGLTTLCTASVMQPNYSFIDPTESGTPDVVRGALRLENQDESKSFGVYPVAGEVVGDYNAEDAFSRSHVERFLTELYPSRYWSGSRWSCWRATRTVPSIEVEPIGDNDLAFVKIPMYPGIVFKTLELERPREAVQGLMGELGKLGAIFGRNFSVECEECIALRKHVRLTEDPLFLKIARLAPMVGTLLKWGEGVVQALKYAEAFLELSRKVADFYQRGFEAYQGLRRLDDLAWDGAGAKVELTRAHCQVLRGDLIEQSGTKYRLAHIRAASSSSADALHRILTEAWDAGRHVEIVVERLDSDGQAIAHVQIRETAEYVNLLMVRRGGADAHRHPENLITSGSYEIMRVNERSK